MVFSEPIFLFLFLPAALLLYHFAARNLRIKNIILALLSLVFYAWGEPVWVILLIFSSVLDFTCGQVIGRFMGKRQAKAAVICSIVINLGLLASFKYANFLIGNINALFGLSVGGTGLTLPIGISFYTFQTLSYSIDVYRGKVKMQKSFADFLLFVSLFPQLIAGPILRYSEIETQISDRRTTPEGFALGATRFLCGLAKKVLLANYCSAAVEKLLAGSGFQSLTVVGSWLGMIMFAFHIYFDFSGYSDMAIGLGKMFGFDYSENFDHPYTSKSITEFWRRWHISLGSFFRDYVYIPLGGNRNGALKQVRNMLIVWGLTGLWHGASWNFVLWGLWFFIFLLIEKLVGMKRIERIPAVIRLPGSFLIVLFGWVFFNFVNLPDAFTVFGAMFGSAPGGAIDTRTRLALINSIPLLVACVVASTGAAAKFARGFVAKMKSGKLSMAAFSLPVIVYNFAASALCAVSLMGTTHNPFIYFRF